MSFIKLLKINNYLKNIALFLPIFFSVSLFTLNYDTIFLNVFIAFCLLTSSFTFFKYIFETLLVASKKNVKIKNKNILFKMFFSAIVFIFIGYLITKHYGCTIFFNLYLIFNVLYILFLKRIKYSDVFEIVINSLILFYAGCSLLGYNPYLSFILFVLFSSLFLGFAKRKALLKKLFNINNIKYYPDLRKDMRLVLYSAILTIFSYIYFVFDSSTLKIIATVSIAFTLVPFIGMIFRLLTLIREDDFIFKMNIFIKDKALRNWTIAYFVIFFLSSNTIGLI